MQLNLNKPFVALNKAYRKQNLNQEQILLFKNKLKTLFLDCEHAENKNESEEHFKNIVSEFLKDTYFKGNYFVNTEKRKDLVIHNDKNAASSIGVIIEVKRPSNKTEMISAEKPNAKALHEILHYYLQERYINDNKDIKHLIITNIYDWYIFDGADFERFFFENPKLKKQYKDWNDGLFGIHKTDWFYQEVAKPFIEKELTELNCTHFNLKEINPTLALPEGEGIKKRGFEGEGIKKRGFEGEGIKKRGFEGEGIKKRGFEGEAAIPPPSGEVRRGFDDHIFIDYYKIFSAEHLLKKPFANDSNTLNKEFYNELLHIIGLEESKDSGKKLIKRKPENNRNEGSLLENTINILQIRNKINAFEQATQFGENHEEQIFSLGLELCITWLNRVLFLKLLEGQLLKYHGGDENYRFLNSERIKDFDELNELFFEVLAVPTEKRDKSVTQKFGNLPYLNSSLFEESDVESKALVVSDLKDRLSMPLMNNTILKTANGTKAGGEANTLQYLFEFLNAYNFESDSTAEIQTQNKTIINASVLGLIFEKINGYKDGSFFTPSFITMYMCRETIRKAVVQKFSQYCLNHDLYDSRISKIETFGDIYNAIGKPISIITANELINSIKICDPAVGSGHFLVSALNEIISIKNDLKILQDKNGKSLNRYEIAIENDELIITNEDGEPFSYNYKSPESQRIQETLFQEKQTIIENCLFGVDINPKSVMICRLRLWIELLKNAYYNPTLDPLLTSPEGGGIAPSPSGGATFRRVGEGLRLQTLPNIDINIKCGNSLVSRFGIDTDLAKALRSIKYSINDYKGFVQDYKNANNKDLKRGLELILKEIKSNFRTEIAKYNNPKMLQLKKLTEELNDRFEASLLFGSQLTEKQQNERDKLVEKVNIIKTELDDLKNAKIYQNAFEWRFEFPEVLDENGNFLGFDAVIGNPPYGASLKEEEKKHLLTIYEHQDYQLDTYLLFIEKSFKILKKEAEFAFIIPNTWLTNLKYKKIRKFVVENTFIHEISHYKKAVFEEAVVDTEALFFKKISMKNELININIFNNTSEILSLTASQNDWYNLDGNAINISLSKAEASLKLKLEKHKNIGELFNIVIGSKPYQVGKGKPKQTQEDVKNRIYDSETKLDENYKPLLRGSDMNKYTNNWNGKRWIKYGQHLAEPRLSANFEADEKIVVRQTGDTLIATLDTEQFICMNNLHVITALNVNISLKYLLAIINSKVADFYHSLLNPEKGEALAEVKKENLEKIPIPNIPLSEQQPFIDLVDLVLAGRKSDGIASSDAVTHIAQIDEMIFALYGITPEEQAMMG